MNDKKNQIKVHIPASGKRVELFVEKDTKGFQVLDTLINNGIVESHDSEGNKIKYNLKQNDSDNLELNDSDNLSLNAKILDWGTNNFTLVPVLKLSTSNSRPPKQYQPKTRFGAFVLGSGLIVLGVVDAATNPFAFATAPELFVAGGALIAISVTGENNK